MSERKYNEQIFLYFSYMAAKDRKRDAPHCPHSFQLVTWSQTRRLVRHWIGQRIKHGDLFPGGKAFSIGVKEGRARMQIAVINCLLYVEYEGKVSRDQGTIRLIL